MSPYSEAFRAKMVKKLASASGPSATALSQEVGVHQSTLSRWLREAARVGGMRQEKRPQGRRPQDWTAAEKLDAVLEAASLSEEDLGGFLRRQGLHRSQLEQWREQMLRGLEEKPRRRSPAKTAEGRRLRELEKELRRKDAALAETAALLVLKKKVAAIWGDGDDDTPPRNGK